MISWKERIISYSINILIGCVILLLFILTVLNFEENSLFLPVIFGLGSVMYGNSSFFEKKQKKKKKARIYSVSAWILLFLMLASIYYLRVIR